IAIAEGIKGAGEDDPVKVADYLHANSVKTPIGQISWNKQGDLNDFKFDVFSWHADGSKTVYGK
ncbi:MAG TPA: leucine ABC transporter subunit substrate-binding protein LivK, partial [Alcaligenes faecalis]|nr:leucine ABC transporter subunit substrate-binding protein LivK [Alcaligenes faecalis]